MNYLAHIFLSGSNSDIQIGNFFGDVIKGKDYQNYPLNILKGILLHRQIDSFTDIHPIVHRSKKRLHPRYGHYAGIIIDILYDYFLSVNWSKYSKTPLDDFIKSFYTNLHTNREALPEDIRSTSSKLITYNWLTKYQSMEGIALVLNGMEKRIKHDIPLHMGIVDLKEKHQALEKDFNEFFPLLIAHSKNTLLTLNDQYEEE